ncbi:choloylglycine hydrolase [Photobacterium jeanii]|uniref:Choloylglycine hydrolase n=1 Tax=Photobacterium jeanii TaxID=858640 RepID=A0A178K7D7_9GAMM|nr:linear amide C-N hydrolase [Photobacterium jeanii]OAN13258.1 choloylglycine hydrolase [Photobacterium jeanii]PST90255.1 linear amide C-N hydrolase [Photobacterium jeanii]
MKSTKLNKITIAALAAVSISGAISTANACSRIIADTEAHGITVARSYDWGERLSSVAKVSPIGMERSSRQVPEYTNPATWNTKYQTVYFEEIETFHGTTGEAINTEGFSASLLYQDPSKAFIKDAADNGTPALHLSDIVPFLVENFKTVDEAVNAFNNGEWQVAWKTGIAGHQHGFHVSVQDKAGNIALFQLNAGGEMKVHRGDANSDLRVMANAPLQQDHRAYVKTFDMTDAEKLPGSISSRDRNVRGLYNSANTKWTADETWEQTRGKMKAMFDAGNLVSQDVIDPTNGATYATWETFVYNLENGEITYFNADTATQVSMNLNDIKQFTTPMCADLVSQASNGGKLTFTTCS